MSLDGKVNPAPEEKWADDVRVHTEDADEVNRIAALLEPGLPDFLEIGDVELEKTAEEISLIDETVLALNIFRLGLGLAPITFSRHRFHLLTEGDWERRAEPVLPGSGAMAVYGHCYLRRRTDRRLLAIDLTHELCHAASYLAIDVIPLPNVRPMLRLHRLGFSHYRQRENRLDFNGLNEAATELAALNLRHVLSLTSAVLTPPEKSSLAGATLYFPHVRLLLDLLSLLTPSKEGTNPSGRPNVGQIGKGAVTPIGAMLRDYCTGSSVFLHSLSRALPGSWRILRRMGIGDDEPLEAAKRLGLTATAIDLQRLLGLD